MSKSVIAVVVALVLVSAACAAPLETSLSTGDAQQVEAVPEWLDQLVPTATPTLVPTPTAVPSPTEVPPTAVPPTPAPTATAEPATPTPTETPSPTAIPEPSPVPATAVPTAAPSPEPPPTPEAPKPEKTLPPTNYDGDLLALRTDSGVMLTVRSVGPNYEVVTPCFNLAQVQRGQPVAGPVDVLIDPGHGGSETGAVGPNGLVEADLNLFVAQLLNDRLTERGYVVQQTRYSDHYVAIQSRAELANALSPRVFVSLHHNGGYPSPSDVPGTEVFVQQGDDAARRLGGLVFEEIQAEFADLDVAWVATDALGVSWRVNRSGTDLYGVLRRTPDLVSVLIEPMYLINAPEAELLAQPAIVAREADAMTRAIERFFSTDDPGSGFIDGLYFLGDLGPGGGTDGCVDPVLD